MIRCPYCARVIKVSQNHGGFISAKCSDCFAELGLEEIRVAVLMEISDNLGEVSAAVTWDDEDKASLRVVGDPASIRTVLAFRSLEESVAAALEADADR